MKINRQQLLSQLNKVLPGISTGTVQVEGADTIVFNNSHIYSYNTSISVDVKAPDGLDLTGVVKAQDFYNCLSKLPSDEIDLDVVKSSPEHQYSSWDITDKNIKVSIKLLPENNLLEKFNSLVPTEDWTDIDGDDFNKALKICTIKGNSSPYSGIYFEGTSAISTNRWIINKVNVKNNYPKFWLSDNAVSELLKWNNFTKIQFNKSWVQFKSTDDVIFSVRSLDTGKYPTEKFMPIFNAALEKNVAFTMDLKPQFYDAISRAAEFSHTLDEHEVVCVEFGKEVKIKGSRTSGDYEEIVSDVSVDIPNSKEMFFDFNDFISSEKFFDRIKVISDTVDFSTTEGVQCILENDCAVKLFSSMV